MDKIKYRAVVKYLFLKGNTPTQIKDELNHVYGDSSPSFTTVKFWAAEFKRGLKSFGDDERSGRPSTTTTDEKIVKVHQMVLHDHRIKALLCRVKIFFGWWSLRCGVWVVFLLALLGNGVVVIVLIIGKSKLDVPRFLVCNLASADFCMGIYLGMLAVVDASTLGEFKVFAIKWQSSISCEIAGFFGVFSSELSVYTLSVITLERNYAITHAMHLNKRLSLRHAFYIMFIGWTFAITMALLPLFGISDYSKFAICLPFETEDFFSLAYVIFLILINGVAFLILMGCYLKMYCAIRGSQAWNSNDSRIARRMALLVFTDFLCWAPVAFFSFTALCGLQLVSLEASEKQVGRIERIGRPLGRSDMVVARCWQQWITEGRVYRRGGSGRPRNTNDREDRAIRRVATSAPTTSLSIQRHLPPSRHPVPSRETIRRRLTEVGLRSRRPLRRYH
ncbi:follicle-stimulating hormone receptor [Trichonephila clavipes]|nr:follicle-stimulating hormone receptor [Trichonephila clavipes]